MNQPIKLAWIDDVLYLEAHPDMDQAIQMEETGQLYTAKMTDENLKDILKAAGDFKDRLHWATIRNAVRDRTGMPVMIARKPGGELHDDYEVIDGHDIDLMAGIIGEEAQTRIEDVAIPNEEEAERVEQAKQNAQEALDDVYDRDVGPAEAEVVVDAAEQGEESLAQDEADDQEEAEPASITRMLNP